MNTDQLQFVTATGSVTVHSLELSEAMEISFGTTQASASVTVTGAIADAGSIVLTDASLTAGSIGGTGTISTLGADRLTSPAFDVAGFGALSVEGGRLVLTDAPAGLSGGTISGGRWLVYDGVLVVPEDISAITGGLVSLAGTAAVQDGAGHNALAGLGSIGSGGTLAIGDQASLTTTVPLISAGSVQLGDYSFPGGTLTVGGAYTETAGGSLDLVTSNILRASSVTIGAGAAAFGDGTIASNLTNQGSVEAAGTLAVTGDYAQAPGATFEAYFGDGTLAVGGKATLAGGLTVLHDPEITLTPGTRSTVMTFTSVAGAFSSHTAGFRVVQGPTQVDVVVLP